MKFTTIFALAGAASAIQLTADPYPLTSGTAAAVSVNPVATHAVGTTGGHDSKTLQSKTSATTFEGDFVPRGDTRPTEQDKWHGFQDGQRFQIHSTMDGGRVLYATQTPIEARSVHPVGKYDVILHSPQFEVHLREAEGSANEYWYWHEKTHTIRSIANGERCLTWDRTASALAAGVRAVVRPCAEFAGENQALRYTKETYQLSSDANAAICLGTRGGKNTEDNQVTFQTCSRADKSQGWYPMYRYQQTGPHWNRLQNE